MSAPVVLIVDDEPVVLRVVEGMLRRAGYEVHATTSAVAALETAQTLACIDLLVADASLPENGWPYFILGETLKERLCPNLRVVLMSGWDSGTLSNKGLLSDLDIFLPKPFDAPQILVAAKQALDGVKGAARPANSDGAASRSLGL